MPGKHWRNAFIAPELHVSRYQRGVRSGLDRTVECIYNESFDDRTKEDDILAPMPNQDQFDAQRLKMHAPKDAPPEFTALYETPLLSKEQEQHLFRKMNFLKYKASRLRDKLVPSRARVQDIDRIEALLDDAAEIKRLLINCNMRLVVSIAKRHAGQTGNVFELVSDGNVSLIRAVEKFDYSRGNKFSTYASWAIMKNLLAAFPTKSIARALRHRTRSCSRPRWTTAATSRRYSTRSSKSAPSEPFAPIPGAASNSRSSACVTASTTTAA